MIVKDPSLFGANFGSMMLHFRFWASSQTLSPMLNGTNFDWIQHFIVCWANSCVARASSQARFKVQMCSSTAGNGDLSTREGRACILL